MAPDAKALAGFREHGSAIAVPDGTCIFKPGDESGAFLFVTSGTVRVEQTNPAGRTVVLYRVAAGESCVLTTSSLLSGRPYSGYGYAEGAVEAVAIDAKRFLKLLSEHADFRELVFRGFADRVGELTDVINQLLHHRVDLRLARWLARRGKGQLQLTQQEIAQELGTAREVVSRALRAFERNGWITLQRGCLTVENTSALLAHGTSEVM